MEICIHMLTRNRYEALIAEELRLEQEWQTNSTLIAAIENDLDAFGATMIPDYRMELECKLDVLRERQLWIQNRLTETEYEKKSLSGFDE